MNEKKAKTVKAIDIVCTFFIATVLGSVTLLNLFQKNRPTVSESENRNLAEKPVFSASTLASGEYFEKLSLFFSDTFWQREQLVDFSKSMDVLRGVDYKINGKPFIILSGDLNKDDDETVMPVTEKPSTTTESTETDPPETEHNNTSNADSESEPQTNEDIPATTPNTQDKDPQTTKPSETNPPVNEPTESQKPEKDTNYDAEFFSNGMFIYGDAVYMQAGYIPSSIQSFMETAKKFENAFGYNVRVSVLAIPTSSMVFEGTPLDSAIRNQEVIFNTLPSLASPSINVVNTHAKMKEHKDEYMYFKTDHHWTNLGAYYAYTAFAESVGFTPTPLSSFEHIIINKEYHGSYYGYTKDERVKYFSDEIHVYIPTKPHTMQITTADSTRKYDCSIIRNRTTYLAFIGGDNAFTEINVPSNPQDRSILVFKDSFGDAFVPYLCEHYGNIYVVDPRYFKGDLGTTMADKKITDVLFVNSLTMVNSSKWSSMYNGLVPYR